MAVSFSNILTSAVILFAQQIYLGATSSPLARSATCPTGWVVWGNNCYFFSIDDDKWYANWEDAQAECVRHATGHPYSGNLVSIHSAEENVFISNYLTLYGNDQFTWIGLKQTSVGPSQPYYWVDGSELVYFSWAEGEPNYEPKDALHCGHLFENGLWGAFVCHDTGIGAALDFVCKTQQADASTTPSSSTPSSTPSFTTPSSTTPFSSAESCPTRGAWQKYGQWCFLFMPNDYVDWHSARQRCQLAATNSTLVSVHDYDEQHFVHTSMVDASLTQAADYHIGLYLDNNMVEFKWLDDTPADYMYWNTGGEPNNPSTEHCVEVSQSTGKWNTVVCSTVQGYACKVRAELWPAAPPAGSESGGSGGQVVGIVIGVLAVGALISLAVVAVWRYRDNISQRLGEVRQRLDQLPRPWHSHDSTQQRPNYQQHDNQSVSGISVTSEAPIATHEAEHRVLA